MSLAIQEDTVTRVLLADGWHKVMKCSFFTDSYEFLSNEDLTVGGGSVPGVPHTGAAWVESIASKRIVVPLTSIIAVECDENQRRGGR
jgi:hypothetical protein